MAYERRARESRAPCCEMQRNSALTIALAVWDWDWPEQELEPESLPARESELDLPALQPDLLQLLAAD